MQGFEVQMPAGEALGAANFRDRLKAAQAAQVLDNITLTLVGSIMIASTTALVIRHEGVGQHVGDWLLLVVLFSLFRYVAALYILRKQLHQTSPDAVLRFLTITALFSGLSWTPVPLVFANLGSNSGMGYIIFVMAGTTTGAVIQSIAYWRTAIAFGAPLMVASLMMLVMSGNSSDYLFAINVFFLTLMLFRASIQGEHAFVAGQNTSMRAAELAQSLASANTEIGRSSQQIEHISGSDSLTGLANRIVFNRRMDALFSLEGPRRREAALILINLDAFKLINDTRGQHAGDVVLKNISERLAGLCGGDDLPVRLGGDEFAVLLHGKGAGTRALRLSQKFLQRVAEPLDVCGEAASVGASIGIAKAPEHAGSAADLYAYADMALSCAKEEGRRRIKLFDSGMKARLDFQRAIDRDLETALDHGELEVHYQPQVAFGEGKVTGFEALIRWKHPVAGVINPPAIVAAAGKLHISEKFTTYVAERACGFLGELDGMGLGEAIVSINITPSEFMLYSPARMLDDVAARHGVDPKRIEVEITEEAILDAEKVEHALGELHNAGFKLAVDDFGMGHSSLAHLISLKIDRLKVDRHFVDGIAQSRHNQALVAALVSVGKALDMDLVMEGVETNADAETLRMLGCRIGQGWLYGKAMPKVEVLAWLKTHWDGAKAVA